MKNVVFFIGSLRGGGTEAKMARNFLPLLKRRGKVNPKLLLLQETGVFLEVLPEKIEKVGLDEDAGTNVVNIIPKFRDALLKLKADVVISCMWYPAIISYLTRKLGLAGFRHIIHDTVNMTEYIKDEFKDERYKWLKIYLTRKAYCDSEAVTVVSRGEREDLIRNFMIPAEKIRVIYNPLNRKMISDMASEDTELKISGPLVVSAGRLVYQKGFDILLKAFKPVRDKIGAKLLILGDGGKKEELISLAESLELSNDVTFLGFQKNPFKFMKEATVFCLATRYEGFPNVILEAMTLGIPVIVTDCYSGASEILDNGKYGILVPPENPDAFANALMKVLTDWQLRTELSALSFRRSREFSFEASLAAYESLVLDS